MDTDVLGAGPEPSAVTHFAELSVVALARSVQLDKKLLPAGALGTVVAAYDDGVGYEVEFDQPFHAVVTLEAADLRA